MASLNTGSSGLCVYTACTCVYLFLYRLARLEDLPRRASHFSSSFKFKGPPYHSAHAPHTTLFLLSPILKPEPNRCAHTTIVAAVDASAVLAEVGAVHFVIPLNASGHHSDSIVVKGRFRYSVVA